MNIINKVALQGLKKNRTRTIVTVIGVVLSAAMITAVITFGISLMDYMARGAGQKYGNWHAAFLDVDAAFVQERILDEEVAGTVSFENIGYAALDGGKNLNKPYLFIAGFSQETFDALPITLISGRLPENSEEALISIRIQTDGGVSYSVGDTLSLSVGNRMNGSEKLFQCEPYTDVETFVVGKEKTYKVVGVCGRPVFEEDSSPGYTLITRTDAIDTADALSLFITLEKPYQVHTYADSVADGHTYILNGNVLRFMGISAGIDDHVFIAFLYSVGCIVVAIVMSGSVFLIYNSFSISLNERMRQIGILSSVGATAKQLRSSVLFEGLCIGAVGIPIGVLVGLGGIGFVISVVSESFGSVFYAGVPLTLKVNVLAIVAAAVVSVVTILISAYLPAKMAASVPVMECIRQTNEVKLEAEAVKTSKHAHGIFGVEGVLALKNFKRNRKRYRSVILSLVLSIVLFIATSSLVADLKQVADPTVEIADCDIGFGTQDMDEKEMLLLYDELKNVAGVYESFYQVYVEYSGIVWADKLSDDYWELLGGSSSEETVNLSLGVRFFDDSTYLKIIESLNLPVEEYTGQNMKVIAVAQLQDNPNRKEGTPLNDMFTETSLELTIVPKTGNGLQIEQRKNLNITFAEFVPPDTPPTTTKSAEEEPYIFWVMLPWSLKEEFVPADVSADMEVLKGMAFQSEKPSQSTVEMRTVIQNAGISSEYILLNMSEMLEENRNMILIVNVFAYAFIVIISLIAVANVFNTISTNIKLRRRELAMLRSVGMSDRDFHKMMQFECVFYGMKALLFGIPLAIAASWFIHKGMFIKDAGMDFILPWISISISVIGVLFIIFITMMYAVGKIKAENIIDALRDDMT